MKKLKFLSKVFGRASPVHAENIPAGRGLLDLYGGGTGGQDIRRGSIRFRGTVYLIGLTFEANFFKKIVIFCFSLLLSLLFSPFFVLGAGAGGWGQIRLFREARSGRGRDY